MNIFPVFQTTLYTISTALLYPVMILLIILSLWMITYAGGFFAEYIKRVRFSSNGSTADYLETIHKEKKLDTEICRNMPVHIIEYAEELKAVLYKNTLFCEERIQDLIQKKEFLLTKDVDKIRLIVRIGPSLGLMGTLIPMGTGLSGLTQGNMAQLSSSLILAFTTTVVGIALGISAYFFSTVKERWAAEDMHNIELITEAMTKKKEIPFFNIKNFKENYEIPEKKIFG